MTNAQTSTLVLKDAAGSYFLVSREALEQGRVPAEHRAEVERLVSETEADDVAGHILPAVGVFTMPVAAAIARQVIEDTGLIQWLEQQMYSGGKA